MAWILVVVCGAVFISFSVSGLLRNLVDFGAEFLLKFKELNRDFTIESGEKLHSSELFKSSVYGRKMLQKYTVKMLASFGLVMLGILYLSICANFLLFMNGYEPGMGKFMPYVFVIIVLGWFLAKKAIMRDLVKELEENSEKIDVSFLKEATE